MSNQDSWDRLFNVLPSEEQAVVSHLISRAKPMEQLSTENGKDLINFRAFVTASNMLYDQFRYHLGDLYRGEMIMGVTIICDYLDCNSFMAVNLWKTGQAVPIFRANMPYAIRMEDKDIILEGKFTDSEAARNFFFN